MFAMFGYKLTYFNLKGRAEVIRYLFSVAGVKYEDSRFERSEWPALKEKTPFGQVPLLEVDGKVMCQSHSIERYLALMFGLSGKTDWDAARADMIIECLEDYIRQLEVVVREKNTNTKNELMIKFTSEQVPQYLDNMDRILKENEAWRSGHFIGSQITVADISFYHMTNMTEAFLRKSVPECWDKWPALAAVRESVNSNPKIQEWIEKRPKTDL